MIDLNRYAEDHDFRFVVISRAIAEDLVSNPKATVTLRLHRSYDDERLISADLVSLSNGREARADG